MILFTAMAANKKNRIKIGRGYTRHTILVKKVVSEKVLMQKAKFSWKQKGGASAWLLRFKL